MFRNFGCSVWYCSGKGEKLGYEGSGFESWFDPTLRFSFFFIETLSVTGQKFLKCLKIVATVYERDNCGGETVNGTLSRFDTHPWARLQSVHLKPRRPELKPEQHLNGIENKNIQLEI